MKNILDNFFFIIFLLLNWAKGQFFIKYIVRRFDYRSGYCLLTFADYKLRSALSHKKHSGSEPTSN